jgi:hypothetical protein
MKVSNSYRLSVLLLVFLYVVVSFLEWFLHYYFMHLNFPKFVKDKISQDNSHINHHKETLLDQTLPDPFLEEGLVFNFLDLETFFLIGLTIGASYLFWTWFKNSIPLSTVLVITILVSIFYLFIWNSLHTQYHSRYIEVNQPLKNNPDITIYSPLRCFIPDTAKAYYKYLLWYHTLHHLNKGEDKCNYNTEFILADFIMGTYKSRVDNTLYFSTRSPQNAREEWLQQHLVFDIRVQDHNIIEYKHGESWKQLPCL